MFSPKLLLAIAVSIVLLIDREYNGVSARPNMRARQEEDPDSETESVPESSPAGRGFLQRIINVIRGVLGSGRAFLTGQTQRIIEYVTTILGNLMGGTSGNLRVRSDEAERELRKVVKETERYTARGQ